MLVIGITGGTGCGKTTALNRIEAMGGCVIDCDAVYHGLLETCWPMLEQIGARFPGVVEGGVLQRKKLGQIVFQDPAALQELSDMTGPYVEAEVKTQLEAAELDGCPLAAIDAIGLCEGGLKDLCSTTVAVLAPTEVRVARLMAREGISEDYARLRIQAQKSNEEFTAMCEHVLMNDHDSVEAFGAVCDTFFQSLLNCSNGGTEKHERTV